jgi:hypothetical protein
LGISRCEPHRAFIDAQLRLGRNATAIYQDLWTRTIEGRVGQRKLWGIVNLARRYPHLFIDAACEAAMEQGVHSYRHVKALTERLVADALAALEADTPKPSASPSTLTQQHALIRSADEYGDLFAHAATQSLEGTQP